MKCSSNVHELFHENFKNHELCHRQKCMNLLFMNYYFHELCHLISGVTLLRVISGGPRFKIFEGPPSTSAKGTSRAPYMHEFSRGSRASSPGKVLNLESLKCHFPDFGE